MYIKNVIFFTILTIVSIFFAAGINAEEIKVSQSSEGSVISIGDLSIDIWPRIIGKISYKGERLINQIYFNINGSNFKNIGRQGNSIEFEQPKIKETNNNIEVVFISVIGSDENGKWEVIQTVLFSKDKKMQIDYQIKNILNKDKDKNAMLYTELTKHYKDSKVIIYADKMWKDGKSTPLETGKYEGEFFGSWGKVTEILFDLKGRIWSIMCKSGITIADFTIFDQNQRYLLGLQSKMEGCSLVYDFSNLE